jgi:hypothetical protein
MPNVKKPIRLSARRHTGRLLQAVSRVPGSQILSAKFIDEKGTYRTVYDCVVRDTATGQIHPSVKVVFHKPAGTTSEAWYAEFTLPEEATV